MKRKNKKRKVRIVVVALLVILSLFIIYLNKPKTTKLSVEIKKQEFQLQDSLQYRKLEEETISRENSQYDSTDEGTIIIMEYCGIKDSVIIPEELDGYRVEKIDSEAFVCSENLEMIKIPIKLAENIGEIEGFERSENLSYDEYIVYITKKEYTDEYLRFIKLTEDEKAKWEVIPAKFVVTWEELSKNIASTYVQSPSLYSLEELYEDAASTYAKIPDRYNLKEHISITAESQKKLGICYAYVTTKSMETCLALREGLVRNFSEIHLAVKSKQYYGGNIDAAYKNYLRYAYGPITEKANTLLTQDYLTEVRGDNTVANNIYSACELENYTLTEVQENEMINALDAVTNGPECYAMGEIRFAYIDGNAKTDPEKAESINQNREQIKKHIMSCGSVYASIAGPNVGDNYFDFGNIAVQSQSKPATKEQGAHAISIIGWDDNFSASNFPTSCGVTTNGAWLALNSWGPTWGNGDGTFWISYEDYNVEKFNFGITDMSVGKTNINANSVEITLACNEYTYNGIARTPSVKFKYNDVEDYNINVDYTVEYSNNINAGTATATITGIGRFTGTKKIHFKILPKDIETIKIYLDSSSYMYDRTEIKPEVVVKYGNDTLSNNTDYIVSYSDNINAGTGVVTITGKGNYTGTRTLNFTILQKNIEDVSINLATDTYTYDGSAKKPEITVKNENVTLSNNADYIVEYSNNINIGTGVVTITGKGNYTGTKTVNFTILPKDINEVTMKLPSSAYTYDGAQKIPEIIVQDGNVTLSNNADYIVEYSNNINAGTGVITIIGKGTYTGTKTANFTILPKNISEVTISLTTNTYTYDGAPKTPEVEIKDGEVVLTKDTQYGVSYSNNINAGTGAVTITGIGNYTGTKEANFTILPKNINEIEINLEKSTYIYDEVEINPEIEVKDGESVLVKDAHYEVEYSNNINIGTGIVTITGIGSYVGTKTLNFTISPKNIEEVTINLEPSTYIYNGVERKPKVIVQDGNITLSNNTDYTVEYSNNINAGVGVAIITGHGNYTGTKTANFTISSKNIEELTINLERSVYTYDGTEKKSEVEVKDEEIVLEEDTDYTVEYSNNINAGTGTVTITGIGNYTGTKIKDFTINKADIKINVNGSTAIFDRKFT